MSNNLEKIPTSEDVLIVVNAFANTPYSLGPNLEPKFRELAKALAEGRVHVDDGGGPGTIDPPPPHPK